MNISSKNLENNKKIGELTEIVENLKLENNNLLNEKKNNLEKILTISKEKEKLQKENKN